ncbi:MAG: hypothetical protein QMD06_04805 [Candidatus Altarchaeum sp.]|nr:hypothetical protein [Candidatus Altarchaeum sp.]
MAEKKEFNGSKAKEKKEKRRKMLLLFGSFIVAITMVLSGLLMSDYYITQQQPQSPVDIVSDLNLKTTEEVIFYVENFSDEFIFITNSGFDWNTLNYMKNMSVKGVKKIEVGYVTNKYYIFKFKLNSTNSTDSDKNDAFNEIYNNFRFSLNIEDKNSLLGVYNGYPYGIAKRFKIFAPVSTQSDDFVTGAWYTMKTNTTTEDVAIISKIIEQCNNMSAVVKNITTVNVEGATDNAKILEKLNINTSSMKIENPKVELGNDKATNILLLKNLINKYPNSILTDNTSNISVINFDNFVINVKNLENLNNSNNTNTSSEIISFEYNFTKEEMDKIMDDALTGTKINNTINPGKITFRIDANIWNKEIYENIKKNLKNLKIEKQGTVSIAESCVNDKKLVAITKNTDFDAVVNLNRKSKDIVKVNINLYSMTGGGEDRYIPYQAVDLDLK